MCKLFPSSDLPWYKVFYRALDKISEFKLAMQVSWNLVLNIIIFLVGNLVIAH